MNVSLFLKFLTLCQCRVDLLQPWNGKLYFLAVLNVTVDRIPLEIDRFKSLVAGQVFNVFEVIDLVVVGLREMRAEIIGLIIAAFTAI